jgi:hypothetical protein
MKRTILTGIVLAALSISAVQAQEQQPFPAIPGPGLGSPGTATPTPYPQITPMNIPKARSGTGSPLLPPIEMPNPPKDQTLPALEQNPKAKTPGG